MTETEDNLAPVQAQGETDRVISAIVLASEGHHEAAALIAGSLSPEGKAAAQAGINTVETPSHTEAYEEAMERLDYMRPMFDAMATTAAVSRADQRRRKLEESRRAASLKLPEVKPSQGVQDKVRLAQEELDKAKALSLGTTLDKLPAKIRTAISRHEATAKSLLRRAETEARSEREAAWVEAAIMESMDLAIARGEVVANEGGQRIMSNRGRGLEDAHAKGYLEAEHGPDRSDELYRAGVRYRDAYEIAQGKTSPKGQGAGGFGPKGPQVRLVEAGADLATMRQSLTMKQRKVLDAVCGEGLGLFEAGKLLGAGMPSVRRSLRGGLTSAADALAEARKLAREASERGEVGQGTGERLRAAGEALERAGRGL